MLFQFRQHRLGNFAREVLIGVVVKNADVVVLADQRLAGRDMALGPAIGGVAVEGFEVAVDAAGMTVAVAFYRGGGKGEVARVKSG